MANDQFLTIPRFASDHSDPREGIATDNLVVATARERAMGLSDAVLLSALDYVLGDRVVDGARLGGRVAGRVIGARDDYRAEARLEPFGDSRCTCDRGQPCRHSAAVAMAYLRRPERFVALADAADPVTRSLFAFAAGRDEPLAPLHVDVVPVQDRPAPDALAAALDSMVPLQAVARLSRWLAGQTLAAGTDLLPLAAWLGRLPTGRAATPATARAMMRLYLAGLVEPLGAAVEAWLGSLEGPSADAARATAEHAAWADAVDEGDDVDVSDRQGRSRRALAWLCDTAGAVGGPSAVAAVAGAHRGLPGAGARLAAALLSLGRLEEAAREAQSAYLHAHGEDAATLYPLLRELGRIGAPGVAEFLRSAWEAHPDGPRLGDLLEMGDETFRARTAASAREVLTAQRRFDLLCALALRERDQDDAIRWALRDDGTFVDAATVRSLAEAVSADRPLLATQLLGAAFRRTPAPAERRRLVARARAIGRGRADLGGGWHTLRRRWFPEGPGADAAPPGGLS